MSTRSSSDLLRRLFAILLIGVLPAALTGCMQTTAPAPQSPPMPVQKVAAKAGVSPRGATVAVVAIVGGEGDVASRFASALSQAAREREVEMVESRAAAYLLRTYLTAAPTPAGVRLTYVFDVFDRRKQRAQRLTDEILVPPRGPDAWSAADDTKIAALAAQGAQDLADALTNTPEALQTADFGAVPSVRSGRRRENGVTAVARDRSREPSDQTARLPMQANHTAQEE